MVCFACFLNKPALCLIFTQCGNYLIAGAVEEPNDSTCNMGCGGNQSQECGGSNRLSVYSSTGNVTALPVAVPLVNNLPGQWQYVGCLA
jgi:hypothetical protein